MEIFYLYKYIFYFFVSFFTEKRFSFVHSASRNKHFFYLVQKKCLIKSKKMRIGDTDVTC